MNYPKQFLYFTNTPQADERHHSQDQKQSQLKRSMLPSAVLYSLSGCIKQSPAGSAMVEQGPPRLLDIPFTDGRT